MCSQCAVGVVVQRVETVGSRVLVDGVDKRGLDPTVPFSNRVSYGRKGGLQHGRRKT